MKKQLITLVSVALASVSAAAALAAPADGGDGHGGKRHLYGGAGMHGAGDPSRMVEHLTRRLELDQSQRQAVENAVSSLQPEMDALRERAEANRTRLQGLDPGASDYPARLNELATEKGAVETEQTVLHGRLKADIHAVLTPGQRQQLSEHSKEMRHRFMKSNQGSREDDQANSD